MNDINAAYEKLIGALNARGTSMPAVNCPEFFALIEEIFTQEQVAIACAMPLGYATLEEIAETLQPSELAHLGQALETMADRGLIEIKTEKGKKVYQFLPLIPGIIEYQFMKGTADEHSKKIAVLYKSYVKAMSSALRSPERPKIVKSAPARKIPVDRSLTAQAVVLPYEEAKKILREADYIAAGTCMCRHQGTLLDKPCSKPTDNCMLFGETARFAAERGFAKALSRDEAIKMLDTAEKLNLIHQYSYVADHDYSVLCNCCICHCSVTRGASKSPVPSQALAVNYVIKIDEDACTGCEACLDRCLMEALKMVDGKLTRDEKRCIGCGLCMYVCPADALIIGKRAPVS